MSDQDDSFDGFVEEPPDESEAQRSIESLVPSMSEIQRWLQLYAAKYYLVVAFSTHAVPEQGTIEVKYTDDGWYERLYHHGWSEWFPMGDDLSDAVLWHMLIKHQYVQLTGASRMRQLKEGARQTLPFLLSLEKCVVENKKDEQETPDS